MRETHTIRCISLRVLTNVCISGRNEISLNVLKDWEHKWMHRGVFACQACTFCLNSPIVSLCSLALPCQLSHSEKGSMLLLDSFQVMLFVMKLLLILSRGSVKCQRSHIENCEFKTCWKYWMEFFFLFYISVNVKRKLKKCHHFIHQSAPEFSSKWLDLSFWWFYHFSGPWKGSNSWVQKYVPSRLWWLCHLF